MKYLLDTNALSEPVQRRPSSRFLERLTRLGAHACTSVLCVGEMIFGARRKGASFCYDQYLAEVVLPHMRVLDVDVAVATVYGELRASLARKGRSVADMDLLIAATAIRHRLELVTRNVRDFHGIDGLEVADWTAA